MMNFGTRLKNGPPNSPSSNPKSLNARLLADGTPSESVLEEGGEVKVAIKMGDEGWEIKSEIREGESHRMNEESYG